MKQLVRFGVSLDHHLLDDFDRHIQRRKYTNRSEALRDLIRNEVKIRKHLARSRSSMTTTCEIYPEN